MPTDGLTTAQHLFLRFVRKNPSGSTFFGRFLFLFSAMNPFPFFPPVSFPLPLDGHCF
jgi:hypothetical protein